MTNQTSKFKRLLNSIGPGLLFASTAIGTSHLVLSTRAGAHHGMIYFWIILGALILKYPFYEFGPRYANATGHSLLKGYKDQGNWAIWLFLFVIGTSMFAVTGAIGALSAGLLSSVLNIDIPITYLSGAIILATVAILLIGGYKGLDRLIKIIAAVLLITVLIAFVGVLQKGAVTPVTGFEPDPILKGAGLTLLISLLGWMPAGMEASAMNSIWTVLKIRNTGYHPPLRETLLDFKIGYLFTAVLALIFMAIGALTVYGTGAKLEGSAMVFSQKLIAVFTNNLGEWSFWVIGIAAFGTIYGTLIAIMDAFPRCFVRGIRVLAFPEIKKNTEQFQFMAKWYRIILVMVAIGGFSLFYFSASSMIRLLEFATILSFVLGPIIAFLNLRSVRSTKVPESHKPPKWLIYLAYSGLTTMVGFALYYSISVVF